MKPLPERLYHTLSRLSAFRLQVRNLHFFVFNELLINTFLAF